MISIPLLKQADYGEPMDFPHGVNCHSYCGNKGLITFAECLECDGVAGIRCFPRQMLLAHIKKEVNEYYLPRWGLFHVSDVNTCAAKFLLSRYIGNFMTPEGLWNVCNGETIHGLYNRAEIGNPENEIGVSHEFKFEDRPLKVVGRQDAFFKELPLERFSDIKWRLDNGDAIMRAHDGTNILRGVLLERKSTRAIKRVLSSPADYHVLQVKTYVGLRVGQDIRWIVVTYFDKNDGKEINLLIPVFYEGSERANALLDDELKMKSLVVNQDKVKQNVEQKAATFDECLRNSQLPCRYPVFKKECDWCGFKDVCQFNTNTNIFDKDKLESLIATWEKAMNVSKRFATDNIADTLKTWL